MTEAKTIGRKRKKNGFTQISNSLLEDSRLSWKAKGILSYLMSRPDYWKVNKVDIQRKATEGRDSVNSAIQELKEFGYLHIYKNINEKGQFDGWIWEYDDVSFEPEQLKNRNSENQHDSAENIQIPRTTVFPNDGFSERRFSSTYNNTGLNNTVINNNKKDKEIKKTNVPTNDLVKEFECIWRLYPRKDGKEVAKKAYIKARKEKTKYEDVENGLKRYLESLNERGTEKEFIPMGSTWFNQRRWQDEFTCTETKKRPKSLMDMYRRDFGGDLDGPERNTSIFSSNEDSVPAYLPQSSYF